MKITSKIILSLALMFAVFGLSGQKADAGTYKIGSYTFTATHCNAQNVCHNPTQAEAASVFAYAIGAGKMTYTHSMSCGNTVKLVIKSCKVTNACKDGNVVSLSSSCKKTTTACSCGCTSGTCNGNCGGPNDDDPNDDNNPDGDPNPPTNVTTTTSCPNGTTIFPADYSGIIPGWALKSTKTYADCGATPPGDGSVPACPFPAADGSCPAPTITFTANPKLISKGGSCKLVWNVGGAGECDLDGDDVSATGDDRSVSPDVTSIYKLTCSNGPTMASKIATCSVQEVDEQ